MKILAKAALIGALVLTAVPARADDDGRKAAQELVDLINTRTLDQMLTSISGAMWPTIEAGMPASIDAGTRAEIRSEFDRITRKYVSEGMKIAPDVYARHFTTDELRQLKAFYMTPLGQKTLVEMPKLTADLTSSALAPMLQPMQTELKDGIEGVLRQHGLLK